MPESGDRRSSPPQSSLRLRENEGEGIGHRASGTDTARNGFTLLELIIVIFLITLILGLSLVFFAPGLSSNKLSATAREISATIRHAKDLAQIHGKKQTITFDLTSRFYGIEGRGHRGIPSQVSVKIIDHFSGEIGEGQYVIVVPSTGGFQGGTIVLSQNKRTVTIESDPIIGAVVIK